MKICPNCSFHLNDDTIICPSCGKNTAEDVIQNVAVNTNEALSSDLPPEKPAFASEKQPGYAAAPQQPPVYGAPQQGFVPQQPPVYGAPQQGYAQQPPVYGAPQQGYAQQPPVYGAPQQGYAQQPPVYGAPQQGYAQQQPPVYRTNQGGYAGQPGAAQVNDRTAEFDPNDIAANKVYAVLSYFGILVLIPLLGAKESRFARFHANQGIVLWIAAIICIAICVIPILGWIVCCIASIVIFVFSIMGIVNAAQGTAKELPLIGTIKILK